MNKGVALDGATISLTQGEMMQARPPTAELKVLDSTSNAIGIPATFLNLILAPSRCSKWKEPRIQEQSNQRQAREGRAAGPFDLLRERENNMNATKNLGTVDFISPMMW